ncbi:MAG: MFS transporter [Rhodobacteraceae bacterium]|jgi:MFS family permease|nr:MFS transporter [Paracoccaceae bacterium]
MLRVLATSWPLLLGMMLLMLGNGLQGTLLGIRGALEGFSTTEMSVVMAGYFVGFLFGSRLTPELIRRVGHVRVFAALGSLISAALVLYAMFPDWMAWTALRVVIGFCFSGVYVTAESWLNNSATNETRGQALSAYMIVQMVGIIAAQGLMNVGDPGGFVLFAVASVLVSLAFTPILLSAAPAPGFGATRPMGLLRLFRVSPLGCVGIFLMGGVFSAIFAMVSVWGSLAGLSVRQISLFIATIYIGGLILQFPIGWISDRMDRRRLIFGVAAVGAVAMLPPVLADPGFGALLVIALVIGGVANPLYSLLLAHTNDFLDQADMAGASGALLFLNGIGAIAGPLITGWVMGQVGPRGFFLFVGAMLLLLVLYSAWRMTRRPGPAVADTGAFAIVVPTASPVAVEAVLSGPGEGQPPRG